MFKPYSFLIENNQTITRSKKTARQFGHKYWRSGKKSNDLDIGIKHIYRTVKDEDGNIKIKRIKIELPKEKPED